jgi:hypothetical protein
MSLTAITVQFPDESVELDNVKEWRVLTTLKMMYEGGSLDGKTANFPTRNLSCVVAGLHRGNWHFFETYKRTIWINLRNGRTIFRCADNTIKSNNSRWWNSLLAKLHVRKLKPIVI